MLNCGVLRGGCRMEALTDSLVAVHTWRYIDTLHLGASQAYTSGSGEFQMFKRSYVGREGREVKLVTAPSKATCDL